MGTKKRKIRAYSDPNQRILVEIRCIRTILRWAYYLNVSLDTAARLPRSRFHLTLDVFRALRKLQGAANLVEVLRCTTGEKLL